MSQAVHLKAVSARVPPRRVAFAVLANKNARYRLASVAGADHHNKQNGAYMSEPKKDNGAALRSEEISLDQLRDRLHVIMEDDDLSQAKVSREVGISAATLSQFLSGSYAGDNESVARKLRTWLDAYEERHSKGGLPQGPEWAETPSALRVIDGLRYAQIAQDMVLIYGGAGLGKTKGIERYTRSAPSVFVATMKPSSAGVLACLLELAKVLNLRDYAHTAHGLHSAICDRLRHTNGLLVIDEAQHLTTLALDQVRSIHDEIGIGIALVGNEHVYTRMTAGKRAAYLDRLFSRIGKRVWLRKASAADADEFTKAWGITDSACRAQLHDIANKPGALRSLNKVLRLAAAYAKAANHKICCDDVRAAARELGVIE